MTGLFEKVIAVVLLISSAVFFGIYAWISDGVYQGGDTYQHYLIARYAPEHPHLFLDHWGKPIYTFIYCLPSQLGYAWAELMTVGLGVGAAMLTYLSARKLKLAFPWLSILLVLFSPMFFVHMNSAMTEILFAFILIAGIYCVLCERIVLAALVFSVLPFARTEGFILLPFIGLYFLLIKRWIPFFLLGSSFVLLSLVGWIYHYHDVLWVFHQNPYSITSFYGHGDLLHFFTSNKVIWGIPFSILLAISLILSFGLGSKSSAEGHRYHWIFLITIPFWIFLGFHSVAWATGTLASNGELRVLNCTMPLAALIAMRFFSWLKQFNKLKITIDLSVLIFAILVIITPFQLLEIPRERGPAEAQIHHAVEWIKQGYAERRIHFVDPQIPTELNRDPFDHDDMVQWFADPMHPEVQMSAGDLLVWDAHFAAHEGRLSYETLKNNPDFQLKATFYPEKSLIIFGNETYFVAVFEYIRQP